MLFGASKAKFFLFFVVVFFSVWVFFHNHSQITGLQGKAEGISSTPQYHFRPLHRYLDISRAITADSSPLHIASRKPLAYERKSLTAKLCLVVEAPPILGSSELH